MAEKPKERDTTAKQKMIHATTDINRVTHDARPRRGEINISHGVSYGKYSSHELHNI